MTCPRNYEAEACRSSLNGRLGERNLGRVGLFHSRRRRRYYALREQAGQLVAGSDLAFRCAVVGHAEEFDLATEGR